MKKKVVSVILAMTMVASMAIGVAEASSMNTNNIRQFNNNHNK